ncbi:MAG: riboflavin synthase [Eubacteriales bacterium]|nr:riboflavin synthase [Eubacteriales bacterium]
MFTGLVEEMGTLLRVEGGNDFLRLVIRAEKIMADLKLGDSVAVNGVCLTVTNLGGNFFHADVMAETMRKTNLGSLKPGDGVNLERALKLSDRLGGHLVSGHIDGVGTIVRQEREGIAVVTEIEAPREVLRYLVPKGSVAVDGISLTVVDVKEGAFTVSLIPHTIKSTTLQFKKPGDAVNLEADLIAKYVEKFLRQKEERQAKTGLTLETLREAGFLDG